MTVGEGLALGCGIGIPLAVLIIAMITLRRNGDKEYMAQQQHRIDDLKEELAKKESRIDYLTQRNAELSERTEKLLTQLLAASTIHKPATNGGDNAL